MRLSWLKELLTDIPLSEVLKERIALADDKVRKAELERHELATELDAAQKKIEQLERELSELKKQSIEDKVGNKLDGDASRVLGYLFNAKGEERDTRYISRRLDLQEGMLDYHLDTLESINFAVCSGGNYVSGAVYWDITPAGRKFAVEHILGK